MVNMSKRRMDWNMKKASKDVHMYHHKVGDKPVRKEENRPVPP